MYKFDTLVVLCFTIVVTHPALLRSVLSLSHLSSLMTQLLGQLISLALPLFGYIKLQEHVLHLMILHLIFFHIRYSLRCVTSVFNNQGQVR